MELENGGHTHAETIKVSTLISPCVQARRALTSEDGAGRFILSQDTSDFLSDQQCSGATGSGSVCIKTVCPTSLALELET